MDDSSSPLLHALILCWRNLVPPFVVVTTRTRGLEIQLQKGDRCKLVLFSKRILGVLTPYFGHLAWSRNVATSANVSTSAATVCDIAEQAQGHPIIAAKLVLSAPTRQKFLAFRVSNSCGGAILEHELNYHFSTTDLAQVSRTSVPSAETAGGIEKNRNPCIFEITEKR